MVRFLKSPTGKPFNLAYFVGDEAEFDAVLESELIEKGMAEKVQNTAAEADAAAKAAAEDQTKKPDPKAAQTGDKTAEKR